MTCITKDIVTVLAFNFAFIQRVILRIPLPPVLRHLNFILNEGLMAKHATKKRSNNYPRAKYEGRMKKKHLVIMKTYRNQSEK